GPADPGFGDPVPVLPPPAIAPYGRFRTRQRLASRGRSRGRRDTCLDTDLPFGADGSATFRFASSRGMLMGDMCTLEFTQLTAELLPQVESWFDDPETIRFLGDRNWVRRALRLVDETPRKEDRGRTVLGRDVCIILTHVPLS